MKQTTITVIIDDIDKKAQDLWEEVVVDVSNNAPCGTWSYNVEHFNTIPMFLANWRYPVSTERAQTRTIMIPFCQHHEEPNSSKLHMELVAARLHASSSVGVIIQSLCIDVSRKQLPN